MLSSNDPRRGARGRRRPETLERLESRTVLNWSPLGSSLADLTLVPSVPPVAAYGGPITFEVDVHNIGHSSIVEPLALVPNSVSTADAQPSVVGVYLSTNGRRFVRSQALRIGEIEVPYLRQNSTFELTETLTMPATRPAGFPESGGRLWVYFRANDTNTVTEIDRTNNVSRGAQPVQIFAPLPELAFEGFSAPPTLSPGDVFEPSFQLANLGTVETLPQGPVLVQLVASTDRNYGPTDLILASYTINNIQPLSEAPSLFTTVLGDVTLDNPNNVLTIGGQTITLPSEPSQYFIGLIADPFQTIRQISDLDGPRSSALSEVRVVGLPIHGLNPANTVGTPAPAANVFPTPAFGLITSPFFPPDPTAAGSGGTTVFATRGSVTISINRLMVTSGRNGGGRNGGAKGGGAGKGNGGGVTPGTMKPGRKINFKK